MGKNSKSSRDLDLEWTMPNVELIQGLFISYNIFKFQDARSFVFCVIVLTHRQTDRHTDTQTDRQTHGDKYRKYKDKSEGYFGKK